MTHSQALLHLVGRPRVEPPGGAVLALPAERRGMLLAALAVRGDWVARSELAALLWPTLARARALANLRKALHQARALPFAHTVETTADAVRWPVATDLQAIARAEREGRGAEAMEMCRGRLLDGFDDRDNGAWSDWLEAERAQHARERQRLARARLQALQQHDPAAAAELARVLLDDDPFDEDAVVALLAAQRALQRYAEQRDTYHHYALRLDEELGVEPSARVRAQLKEAAPAASVAPAARDAEGLIGRAAERDALLAALAQRGRRAVVITGPGGVGKSSLLKAALQRWDAATPALWLPLDDLADAGQMLARLASELAFVPPPGGDLLAGICGRLATKPRLLALDNCEHIDGIERVASRLLDAHPDVQIVATSRRRLDLAAAHSMPLEGLSLPADACAPGAMADESDAWRLFARAAVEAQPGLDAQSQAAVIGRIVAHLGGMPLAILLAAPWVRHLSLLQIEAELSGSLDLLESDEEGEERPEHRSLRDTFERSWRALTVREQRCLAALSVFPGEASRAAAQAVGAASMPLLALLADKSLLRLGPGARVAMHPLLRHFAAEKLAADAHAEALRRHAQFHLQWMARQAAAFDRVELAAMRELGTELENCRAAWRWAIAHRAHDAIASCAPVLKQHYALHGSAADGIALLNEACDAVGDAPPWAGASLNLALAQLNSRVGRIDDAEAFGRRAIGLARSAGHREIIARGLLVLGGNQLQRGRSREALRCFQQAERHARAAHDTLGISLALSGASMVQCDLGEHERAAHATEEAIRHYAALGQWARAAVNLNNLAYIRLVQQEWAAAERAAADGMAICEREGIEQTRPSLWLNLAAAATGAGRHDEADRHCQASIALAQRHLNRDIEANAAAQRVRVAIARGDLHAARARLREALPLARAEPHRQARLDLVLSYLRIAAAEGRREPARDWLRWYLEQPYLEPADRATAEQCLARIGARTRRAKRAQLALDEMLAQMDDSLRDSLR